MIRRAAMAAGSGEPAAAPALAGAGDPQEVLVKILTLPTFSQHVVEVG